MKRHAIANVRGHVPRLDGTVKSVDRAGGGPVGVGLKVPLIYGACGKEEGEREKRGTNALSFHVEAFIILDILKGAF